MRALIAVAAVVVVMMGGPANAQQAAPQWWDLNGLGAEPSPRHDAAIAPTPSGEVVLFGGTGATGDLNDTWLWTAQGWSRQAPAVAPPPMKWARMVFDSSSNRNVLVGYSSDSRNPGPQTWFWDGQAWTSLAAGALRAEPGFSLAFDEATGQVLMFGGYAGYGPENPCLDDTWILSGNQWTWISGSHPPGPMAAPATSAAAIPPARANGGIAFDRVRRQIVLHGGFNQCRASDQVLTDTWVWDGIAKTWTEMQPAAVPPANDQGYQLAYYGIGGYIVAAGCTSQSCSMYQATALWKWDGTNWSAIPGPGPQDPTTPWTMPRADYGFSLSAVPGYDGLLLFGGYDYLTLLGETWAWGTLPEILNTAPSAKIVVQPGTEVACSAVDGAPVTLDGRESTDAEHQPLTYLWTGPFGSRTTALADVTLPIGRNTVSLQVDDGDLQGTATETILVTVTVLGFESPLGVLARADGPLPPLPTVSFEAGRTLPLKLSMRCGSQALSASNVSAPILTSTSLLSTVVGAVPTLDPPAVSADSGGLFRAQGTNWIYNLQTKGLPPGTYELVVQMPDTLAYRALIALR